MDRLEKIISDDCVEYRIYFTGSGDCDENFALATLSSVLSEVKQLSKAWLWHSEEFSLEVVRSESPEDCTKAPTHLYGLTHFGDNLDDEWFIVYMLLELTKKFTDLVVSLEDTDGQFLLIETANALPRWLTPECAENRVFLHKGLIHIIPHVSNPGQVGIFPIGTPRIRDALQLVLNEQIATESDTAIQECLAAKLSVFPAHVRASQHITQCTLPVPAAHVLHNDPSLVAPAVQAFYARDPLQMRSCRTMKYFPPSKPKDCITMNVTFTKCLYAQLRQQRYRPGIKSGWQVPPATDERHVACDLGMKLSYGLEILRKQAPKTVAETSSGVPACSADVCVGPRWEKFLLCLKDRDYFHGELEGSKEYQRLLKEAQEYYANLLAKEDSPSSECLRRSTDIGRRVKHLLDDVPTDVDRLHQLSKEVSPADSEDWMSVKQEDLDKLLDQYRSNSGDLAANSPQSEGMSAASKSTSFQAQNSSSHPATGPPESGEELQKLVANMKTFMSGLAGPEGAEFPTPGGMDFSAQGFASAMSSLLNVYDDEGSDDDDDSDIDIGDDIDFGDLDGASDSSAMKSYLEEMDRQLADTGLGESFERHAAPGDTLGSDDLPPVDIDMNLVKNLLASYSAQDGLAGPAANILHGMGVHLPSLDQSAAGIGSQKL